MRLLQLIGLAALTLNICACQSLFKPDTDTPLEFEKHAWEHSKAGCQGEQCPLVNVEYASFADAPELNAIVDRALRGMTRNAPDAPLPESLQGYEQAFLNSAEPGWSSYLQAKVLEQHDGLVIVELSSYLFTGGAHGMPGRAYINYDRKLNRVLSLEDMLLPGQEAAFWQQAQLAHKSWLIANKLDQDADYVKTWPFQRTNNIALTYGAVMLKYDVYSIAPYSSGHPELRITYPRLNGILKPQYFPGRG